MENSNCSFKFCPFAFGLACGLLWSLSLVVTAIFAGCCDTWGADFMRVMSGVYVGFGTSFFGIVAGFFWGLLDGFIGGFLLAWLYNKISSCNCSKCLCMKCKCDKSGAEV